MGDSAFPGITVRRIDTRDSVRGEGEPLFEGVIEDVSKLTPQMIRDRLDGETNLVYTMDIVGLTKTGARMRGKMFVRTKNPFEPTVIDTVMPPNKTDDKTFTLSIGVEK